MRLRDWAMMPTRVVIRHACGASRKRTVKERTRLANLAYYHTGFCSGIKKNTGIKRRCGYRLEPGMED